MADSDKPTPKKVVEKDASVVVQSRVQVKPAAKKVLIWRYDLLWCVIELLGEARRAFNAATR
jgi:hypothetical protein